MLAVLLVEDEAPIRQIIETALAAHGVDVRSVGDDKAAYKLLDKDAASFGALVADINLGGGETGFDVARRARKLNPKMAIIYITGQALNVDRFGVEGAMLFPKPFNLDDLAEMVLAVIA
jgi:DNA-binding response OmpR family regulator